MSAQIICQNCWMNKTKVIEVSERALADVGNDIHRQTVQTLPSDAE